MDMKPGQYSPGSVRQLSDFFKGYSKAHGHSELTGEYRKEDGKAIARSWTDKAPVTQHDWDDHIAGTTGLGIHILLDDNVSVRFGVIDVDQYKLDLFGLSEKIADLPLTLFRSKSGGAHLHCGIAEPRSAASMIKLLNGFAARLGFAGCEIFPKQTSRDESAEQLGSWINAPYFGGDRSSRYAIAKREGLSLGEALNHLAMKQLSGEGFDRWVTEVGLDSPPPKAAPTKTQKPVLTLVKGSTPPRTSMSEGQAFASDRLQHYIRELRQIAKGDRNNKLSERAYWLGQMVARGWIDDETAKTSLRDAINGFWSLDKFDRRRMYRSIIAGVNRGKKVPHAEISKILDPSDPLTIAKKMVAGAMTDANGNRIMQRQRGAFYQFRENFFHEVKDEEIRSRVWRYLGRAQCWDAKANAAVPFKPNKHIVANVVEALQSVCMIADRDPPFWINKGDDQPPPNELFICGNGLLHLKEKRLIPATPNFFCLSGSNVHYDETATCPEWDKFLGTIWADDPQSNTALKEWFGYFLSQDTKLQKVLLIIGPKRGGKGTIGRIAKALLGADSVIGPTLHSLGKEYGPQELIGKSLAVISDARMSSKSDANAISEMLLAISGEDARTIPRKYLSAWTGRLTVRFMVLATEIPSLPDESGGLPNRFMVLPLTESFFGREDHDLEKKLMAELPGILNWAVDGYRMLTERGRFVQPESGAETIKDMERIAEPIATWASENLHFETEDERQERLAKPPCIQRSGESDIDFWTRWSVEGNGEPFETLQDMYNNWKWWCEDTGRKTGSDASFAKKLRAVFPKIRSDRPKNDKGKPLTVYLGVKLRRDTAF